MYKSNKMIYLVLLLSLILVSQMVLATPATPPCDERIENKEIYENIILSNDIIKKINNELTLTKVNVVDCFVGGKVRITLYYELPQNLSSYGITYSDDLAISYYKNGSITTGSYNKEEILDYNKAIETIKSNVLEIENNTRVQEFITKMRPATGSLIETDARIAADGGWIGYRRGSKLVTEYLLPNSIEWEQFPEIKRAHEIIEQNLLNNESLNCSIGKGDMHSYTTLEFYYSEDQPMYLTVALVCDVGWKDASVHLNSDDSYERLRISMDYTVRRGETGFGRVNYLIPLLVIVLIIGAVLFSVKRRRNK